MTIPDVGCRAERRGFLWDYQMPLVGGEAAIPDTACGGETGILMEVPNAAFGGGEAGFSWQSQMLFVGVETGVLMGVPDMVVGEDRLGFSWQSQTLFVGGRSCGSHGSPRCWLWGYSLGSCE